MTKPRNEPGGEGGNDAHADNAPPSRRRKKHMRRRKTKLEHVPEADKAKKKKKKKGKSHRHRHSAHGNEKWRERARERRKMHSSRTQGRIANDEDDQQQTQRSLVTILSQKSLVVKAEN